MKIPGVRLESGSLAAGLFAPSQVLVLGWALGKRNIFLTSLLLSEMNIMDQKAPLQYPVTDLLATEISACPAFVGLPVETLQLFADRQLHLSLLIETATISGFSFLQGFSDLARPSVNLSTADAIALSPSSHALSCLAPKTVLNLSREVLIHILPMILKPPDPGRGCRVALMHSRSSSVMLRCLVLHVPPLDLELPAHPYSTSSGDRV